MFDPADGSRHTALERVVSDSAAVSMHCLAAAERAVLDGRFNLSKVLRACAHSERLTALTAARLLAAEQPPSDPTTTLRLVERHTRDRAALTKLLAASPGAMPKLSGTESEALPDILRRSLQSLEQNRDVLESDVAQSLWGCQVCGALVEGSAPQGCSDCGALQFEFDWFGPFYSGTFERLGRRAPADITAILEKSPSQLASLLSGIGEQRLARRPSDDEWSMKEIAGHLIDTTEVFCARVRAIRTATSPPALNEALPPWRILEGKGYPDHVSMAIVEAFRATTADAVALIAGFAVSDWGRFGLIAGRRATTILDLGTWLANHNIAHLAQIEALRELHGS